MAHVIKGRTDLPPHTFVHKQKVIPPCAILAP